MYKIILLFIINIQAVYAAINCEEIRREYSCPNGATYPVHLTFDDGPVVKNTDKVLAALAKHQVPATFFVVADRLGADQPEEHFRIMRRIQQAGHTIASHSHHHHTHTELSQEDLEKYIESARYRGQDWTVDGERLGDYLTPPPLLRLPYGDGWHELTKNPSRSEAVMQELFKHGFSHVGWDFHAYDWDRRRQQDPGILHYLLRNICEEQGGIALLHDLQKNTADNIGEWIEAIKCLGHTFSDIKPFLQTNDVVTMCRTKLDDPVGDGTAQELIKDIKGVLNAHE